jgi:hypothetical protein
MNKVFLAYDFNGKESDYIPSLKDELESHGVQIYDTNYLGVKDDIRGAFRDSLNICDLLIAFMIDNNSNAAYYVGYAMSKGKKVLIISDNSSDTSFDLEMAPTILLRDFSETSCDILNFIDNC